MQLDWLETQFYGFLRSKKNNVETEKISRAIRSKAREKGYTDEQMNAALKTALEYRKNVDYQSKQAATPESAQESTTPAQKEVIQDNRTEAELSRRTQRSYEPMPERKDSDSAILRMSDAKRDSTKRP